MKVIKIAAILSVIVYLGGCSVSQVIDANNPDKPVGGYQVQVSNYDKIQDKKVNLKFKVADEGDLGKFDWDSVAQKATSYIIEKGVEVSDSGKPVTVVMNDFIAWDRSQFPARRSYGTGIAGGSVISLGGSIVQAVAASIVESEVTAHVRNNQEAKVECKSNCIPEASFTIHAEDYQTTVNLMHTQGFSNYVSITQMMVSRAIADMFEPSE